MVSKLKIGLETKVVKAIWSLEVISLRQMNLISGKLTSMSVRKTTTRISFLIFMKLSKFQVRIRRLSNVWNTRTRLYEGEVSHDKVQAMESL